MKSFGWYYTAHLNSCCFNIFFNAMIYQFEQYIPVVHESSFVHEQACVLGNVIIGRDCYIGPGAVLRGDWGQIVLEDGCNVQENCVVHLFPGVQVLMQAGAHIGHGAIIHGATIGRNCLVGMNAVVMDNVVLGEECIVGALSFVKAGEVFEARSLIVGNPAKKIKAVSDEMIQWKTAGTQLYQQLPAQMQAGLRACAPLKAVEHNRPMQPKNYFPFGQAEGD
jgi:phenylacetic acid degradation protein